MVDRFTPLAGPDDAILREALTFPHALYGERFVDADFWRPIIDLICAQLDVPPVEVASGEPGTFPTFIIDRALVVKLFGRPFDGLRCWQAEVDVANAIGTEIAGIAIPEVIVAGVLSDDPAWRYIVYRFIDGVPYALAQASMNQPQRLALAGRLGTMIRAVHDLPVPNGSVLRPGWDDWHAFIATQKRGLTERHRRWSVLPEMLIAQLDDHVAIDAVDMDEHPSLLHADLHQYHVLVNDGHDHQSQICGIIDWGDARVGNRFYELPALHLGLFRGDAEMLAAFLEAYGWDDHRSDAFVHRAMTMTLLHEFNVLETTAVARETTSLDTLAEAIWRV